MKTKTLLCTLAITVILALSAIAIPDSTPDNSNNETGIILLNDLDDADTTEN